MTINVRGMPFRNEDDAMEFFRQREIDEADAKRNASGMSPEILSLQDACQAGQRAAGKGQSAAMNPYQSGVPEHAEWERCRAAVIAEAFEEPRLRRKA